jgi:LAO/AO transport system kinase
MPKLKTLVEKLVQGDKRVAAKLITLAENDFESAKNISKLIHPYTGNAQIVGITGPPGVGKSTLIDKIVSLMGERKIGVIAVDVTSPFSGGAFLGDRLRMSLDQETFMRSMATRGAVGGISRATRDAIRILDAMGRDMILVETVGSGQDEVEIMNMSHTCIVVTFPGHGDEIQIIKAGMMEIADIFVVNKADREGAERVVEEIRMMLDMSGMKWKPPIIKTIAVKGEGCGDVVREIERHFDYLKREEMEKWKRKNVESELLDIMKVMVEDKVKLAREGKEYETIVEKVMKKEMDPFEAAERILGMDV